ncbi:hypothetical protein ACHAXS_010816, partial [Conticribra weissflogii]
DNSGVDNDDTTNLPDCEEGIDPIVLATQETNQNSTNNNNSNNQTNGEDNEVIRRKMLRNSSSRKAIVAHSRKLNCNDQIITHVQGNSRKEEHHPK